MWKIPVSKMYLVGDFKGLKYLGRPWMRWSYQFFNTSRLWKRSIHDKLKRSHALCGYLVFVNYSPEFTFRLVNKLNNLIFEDKYDITDIFHN